MARAPKGGNGRARDIMHQGAECIGEQGTLARAAEMMRDLHVGALPICGEDGRLHGIITDRDRGALPRRRARSDHHHRR
jgi:CBS domain-containing protein